MTLLTLTGAILVTAVAASLLPAAPTSDDRAVRPGGEASDGPPSGEIDWAKVDPFTLTAETLDGKPFPLEPLRGKVVLVVNVASYCGFTRQYADLQALHDRFAEDGLAVIGVPSNDFGNQEPGTPQEIREFCSSRFGVTFPLLAKAEVKPGDGQHPLFRVLVARTGEAPKWNFTKYLIARDGTRTQAFASRVSPGDESFVELVEKLLAEAVPAGDERSPSGARSGSGDGGGGAPSATP